MSVGADVTRRTLRTSFAACLATAIVLEWATLLVTAARPLESRTGALVPALRDAYEGLGLLSVALLVVVGGLLAHLFLGSARRVAVAAWLPIPGYVVLDSLFGGNPSNLGPIVWVFAALVGLVPAVPAAAAREALDRRPPTAP